MTVIPDPQVNRKSSDRIISVVSWLNNDTLFAISMNRVQNKADLQRCEVSHTGKASCHTVNTTFCCNLRIIEIMFCSRYSKKYSSNRWNLKLDG